MTNVLIVDDDGVARRVLSSALAGAGFGVSTASDAICARRLAEVAPPAIALVQLHVPHGGLDLVRELKRLAASIFVIVLAGEASLTIRAASLRAGADVVLAKPDVPAELRREVLSAARAAERKLRAS